MKIIKAIIFFTLAMIFVPMFFIIGLFGEGTEGKGWFQEVWDKGSTVEKVVAVVISPVFWFVFLFMNFLEEPWEKLME